MRKVHEKKRKYLSDPHYYASIPISDAILKIGCNETSLRRWEKEQGIKRETPRDKVRRVKQKMIENRHEWVKDGQAIYSLRELESRYGICSATISNLMADEGIKPLNKPTARQGGNFSETQPYVPSSVARLCREASKWRRPPGIDEHIERLRA